MQYLVFLLVNILVATSNAFHSFARKRSQPFYKNVRQFQKQKHIQRGVLTPIVTSSILSSKTQSTDETEGKSLFVPGRPTWQQTMLRITDPAKSLPFYTEIMGMTLIDKFDFPQYDFSLYFLTTLPEKERNNYKLVPGTQEAHDYLWSMEGTTLELTHNYGTEKVKDSNTKVYHAGNEERDGFGHIAFSCDDVYQATDMLIDKKVSFKKKPDEGRMKGLAFAYDPDGYWVELVQRPTSTLSSKQIKNMFNLSQTMLRVKDPKKSLKFYQNLGMTLLCERHFDDFSLYYLASDLEQISYPIEDSKSDIAKDNAYSKFGPLLELTHNHGTESKENNFEGYYNGNEDGKQGFGHIGFLVDDVYKACDSIREMGYGFRKVRIKLKCYIMFILSLLCINRLYYEFKYFRNLMVDL